ncbi:MAG: hypothetical protein ACK5HL_00655 [Bacilli bacterium]
MYPEEIYNYLKGRNFRIGGDEVTEVTSLYKNPQLIYIGLRVYNNKCYYKMKDKFDNEYDFEVMPFNEAIEKGLVKKIKYY